MGDPSREEEHRKRPRDVCRVERERIAMDEVPSVVEHHDRHDETAEQIDGIDAGFRAPGRWFPASRHDGRDVRPIPGS